MCKGEGSRFLEIHAGLCDVYYLMASPTPSIVQEMLLTEIISQKRRLDSMKPCMETEGSNEVSLHKK